MENLQKKWEKLQLPAKSAENLVFFNNSIRDASFWQAYRQGRFRVRLTGNICGSVSIGDPTE